MAAAGARVEDGFSHHSRRSALWRAKGGPQHDHMIPDYPCITCVKLQHDSPWFIRSSLFEPIVHLQFHLIQFAAPEAYPPMKSRDHSEYLIFAANMGKLETSMHGINPSIQERSFNTSLDQCPWCQNDKLYPVLDQAISDFHIFSRLDFHIFHCNLFLGMIQNCWAD